MRARDIMAESISFGQGDMPERYSSQGFRDRAVELSQITREYVESHCQPWLSQVGSGLAYRGVSPRVHQNRPLFTHPVRQNRKPRDSTWETHQFFNRLIGLAGGVANRSNSVFVTPRLSTATSYGLAYVVIPVGQFHYTWSPGVEDWFSEEKEVRSWWDPELVMKHVHLNRILYALDQAQMIPTDPSNPLEELHQIRYQSDYYRAYQFARDAELRVSCYSKQSVNIMVDRGLNSALSRGHEIMIHAREILYLDAVAHSAMVHYRVNPF